MRLANVGLGSRLHHFRSAPLGMGLHGLAIVGVSLLALHAGNEPLPPPFSPRLTLQLAPPAPSPLLRGTTGERLSSSEDRRPRPTRTQVSPATLPRITEAFLHSAPALDLRPGWEDGFDDGTLHGLPAGLVGGILGGVPGGLVGGTVGGTGRALPRFPKPDVGPSPIDMPQPSYTEEAIRNNVTGSVVLRVVIDERGSVSVLEVLRSVPELDEEAIRVVESRWRFRPATRDGRPVATLSDLKVRFQLH